MPINYLQKTINIYPVKSDNVINQSNVAGTTLTDALNTLMGMSGGGIGTKMQFGSTEEPQLL